MNRETKKVFDEIVETNEIVIMLNQHRNFKDFSEKLSNFIVEFVNNNDKLKRLDRNKIDLIKISRELF